MRTSLRLSVIAALLLSTAGIAQAQTIRVVANEAVVRLKPDPNSPSIATVQAGALLQVRGKDGFWYSVSLPTENSQVPRVGYISVTDVEVFAAPAVAAPTQAASASPDWQSRYDRTQRRISSGKKKFWLGMAASGIGLGLMVYQTSASGVECNRFGCQSTGPDQNLYWAGMYASLGGAALSAWGGIQWAFASGDRAQLELERLATKTSTLRIPIGATEMVRLAIVLDARPQASLQVEW